jgi:hypothetical protein
VIVRVWRAKIDPGRIEEYQRFEEVAALGLGSRR